MFWDVWYKFVQRPPRTGVESPPIGQTLGSGEPPEGRLRITKRPFKKKALDTAVRSTTEEHTVNKRPSVNRRTDNMRQSKQTSAMDRTPPPKL
jgi:hypothetical protein